MPVTVRVPPVWRKHTRRKAELPVGGRTVREVLASLAEEYPDLGSRLYGSDGELAQGLSVFLNHDSVRHLQGQDTPVADGDRVMILIAMAGG
jgi:molybdopterin converting factor small subunit